MIELRRFLVLTAFEVHMRAIHERVDFKPNTRFNTAFRSEKRFAFAWHYHPEYEITLVLNGSGWRYLGNSVEAYTGPELVFIPPEVPHSWLSDPSPDKQDALVLQFNERCLGEGFWTCTDFADAGGLFSTGDALVFGEQVVADVKPVMERFLMATGLQRIACFIEVIEILVRSQPRHVSFENYQPALDRESQEKVNAIIGWIQDHNHHQVSVVEAASFLNMSESTFRRFFKRNTGKSLIAFVNESRIHQVCKRFTGEDTSVTEAAMDAGFNNLAHFNRLFRNQMGMTPREFKRQQRQRVGGK